MLRSLWLAASELLLLLMLTIMLPACAVGCSAVYRCFTSEVVVSSGSETTPDFPTLYRSASCFLYNSHVLPVMVFAYVL